MVVQSGPAATDVRGVTAHAATHVGGGARLVAPDGFVAQVVHPQITWAEEMAWNRAAGSREGYAADFRPRKQTDSRRVWQLVMAYAPDWILTFLLAGLLSILNKIHGFWREFSLTDTSIQHIFAEHERVPTSMLVVYMVIIPIIILVIWTLLVHRSGWECNVALLSFILAQALTLTATTIMKVTVGRPRPDFIDRCKPRAGAMNAVPYGLATTAVCTADTASGEFRDGLRSFPSGHASTAFCGMAFLALYFTAKLRRTRLEAASSWLAFIFMMAAALIAISRTMDYRHHATDVIAGGILGTAISVFTYLRYYPLPTAPYCYKPYPPRVPRTGSSGESLLHRYEPHHIPTAVPLEDPEANFSTSPPHRHYHHGQHDSGNANGGVPTHSYADQQIPVVVAPPAGPAASPANPPQHQHQQQHVGEGGYYQAPHYPSA